MSLETTNLSNEDANLDLFDFIAKSEASELPDTEMYEPLDIYEAGEWDSVDEKITYGFTFLQSDEND